ncbi:MAG TPA: hypothetical protein VFO39_18675 [Candidatus Sulfotelmatobacter sp.]|nr:hypothetical protein [Candidatus Sulfotelmatobacter sp.]
MSIHLRLDEINQTVEHIGMKGAADEFRAVPDHLIRAGDLDLSFCRSLESHITDLNPEFLRAAKAYCGTISSFAEAESNAWNAVKETKKVQDVLRSADDLEAQLALACAFDTAEKGFYILEFEMILHSAQKMGLPRRDLLAGSTKLGLPDLSIPASFIGDYVRTRFHVDCESGQKVH